jgi:catechol 2,3-dioxygenase-like lactoylglutathione lyase family enzyme
MREESASMDMKLEVVVLPVSDVDRAKEFYAERCGFHVDVDDSPNPKFRIVQMTPPGSGCSVTVGTGLAEMEPGSLKGLQLVVEDVEAARAFLSGNGVDVSPVRHVDMATGEWIDGHGGPWNSFIFFDDPDGNAWTVQEKPA